MSIVILIVIILDEELGSWLETLGIKCQSDLPNKIITKVAKALNKTEGGSCTSVETIFLLVLTFFLLGKVRIYKLVQLDPQTSTGSSLLHLTVNQQTPVGESRERVGGH